MEVDEFDKKYEEDTKEIDEIFDNLKKSEREGVKNILKYFDRIHDKLFTFNNILIAGYFALSQFFDSFSVYGLIIPILNLCFLLIIEYRMMEMSRFDSKVTNKTSDDITKNGKAISRTNRYSLYTIISTSVVVLIFLLNLFSLDSKVSAQADSKSSMPIVKTLEIIQKDSLPISILGAWTNNQTENATFAFYEDSMIYVDALQYVKYELKSDTLIRYFDGIIDTSLIATLTTDSLIIESKYGVEYYGKFTD